MIEEPFARQALGPNPVDCISPSRECCRVQCFGYRTPAPARRLGADHSELTARVNGTENVLNARLAKLSASFRRCTAIQSDANEVEGKRSRSHLKTEHLCVTYIDNG